MIIMKIFIKTSLPADGVPVKGNGMSGREGADGDDQCYVKNC